MNRRSLLGCTLHANDRHARARGAIHVLVASVLTATTSTASIAAESHLDLVARTPCLLEFREWFFSPRRTDVFPVPPKFTDAECDEAKRVHERIQKEQAALAAEADRRAQEQEQAVRAAAARRAKLPGVRIGMTANQVLTRTHWGAPERINRTTDSRGTREQWIYGDGHYLYFENGRVTAIQDRPIDR